MRIEKHKHFENKCDYLMACINNQFICFIDYFIMFNIYLLVDNFPLLFLGEKITLISNYMVWVFILSFSLKIYIYIYSIKSESQVLAMEWDILWLLKNLKTKINKRTSQDNIDIHKMVWHIKLMIYSFSTVMII